MSNLAKYGIAAIAAFLVLGVLLAMVENFDSAVDDAVPDVELME